MKRMGGREAAFFVSTKEEKKMPVITIDIGAMTREKKAQLVRTLSRDASEITGIPEDKFIVLIKELDRDNIGVGGRLLSDIIPAGS
jgi:4-oxalocrotonate tautomerase